MQYQHVCLETFGYTLPDEVVTTSQLEQRLQPLYSRLRLPEGRLELITGIRERRFWQPDTVASDKSIESAEKAIRASGIDRGEIGALVHGSVCRDHLEPATACRVHHHLQLPKQCQIYDVSNACLGVLNGLVQVANMIELGQIRCGLVVGTESSRSLVDTTINHLNHDRALTRRDIKSAVASLTIGSASCAVLMTHRDISRTGNRLLGGVSIANTDHHRLCHSGHDQAGGDRMRPLMQTDSEKLMAEGIATGTEALAELLDQLDWTRDDIDKTFCHQVGPTHRKLLLEALGLNPKTDFSTVEFLGNTGSVALPVAMAMGIEQQHVDPHDQVALLGIGSGINCLLLGVQWQKAAFASQAPTETRSTAAV